ncbi:MAG: exo-alpha-sialidase [Lentisphaerae bacterium]|nr:exo-alpha-sialidase [Lentisphaerota bacterium]
MKPTLIASFPYKPVILRLGDGTLQAVFPRCGEGIGAEKAPYVASEIAARFSRDNGRTWTEEQALFRLPSAHGGWWGVEGIEAFVDDQDEVHVFLLNDARTGVVPSETSAGATTGGEAERPAADTLQTMRLDIWHAKSGDGRKNWRSPQCLWKGYTGALNSVIQLRNGRILLPFSYLTDRAWGGNRGGGLDSFTFKGQYDCTLLYSDDRGATWHLSPAALNVVVPDIVSAYGAVEPVVVELMDGRVWMLIRTQLGRFYESFSRDGIAWSAPRPTGLLSSDSPPGLVRLSDGRLVMFWNLCLRYPYAYGGRQVLHAAISGDDGKTWRGYREVLRDPLRGEPPPPTGDHGTGYPFPMVANDDLVILSSGQGPERKRYACVLIDPAWLYETRQKADFTAEQGEWHTFGTKGVVFAPHPEKKRQHVLSIRKPEKDWPAAAVWNFPAGLRGRLTLKVFLKPGFGGARIGLTDHFSAPFDLEDGFYNLFTLEIGLGGRIADGVALLADAWSAISFSWDCARRRCRVSVAGRKAAVLTQARASDSGPCYLRLASAAETTDEAGWLVEAVAADVS